MRNLKKVLTLVLAVVMVCGCLVVGAGAAYTDDAAISYTDEVSTLTALGVFEGADGAFNPKNNITRQEVAKIVAMTLTGGTLDPTLYEDAKIFTDVDGLWGEGYINYLAGQGLAAGDAGKYRPNDNMTAQELAKFVLVALGYPEELFVGTNWAANINRIASSEGLYNKYIGSYAKAVTREEAALILYNGLIQNVQQATWDGNISATTGAWSWKWEDLDTDPSTDVIDPITGIEKYFNCEGTNGFVVATSNEYAELTGTNVVVAYGADIEDETTWASFRDGSTATTDKVASYEGALGAPVTVYTNKDTKAVICVGARTIKTDATENTVISYTTTAKIPTPTAAKAALAGAGFASALLADPALLDAVVEDTANGLKVTFQQATDQPTDFTETDDATADGYKVWTKTEYGIDPYEVTEVTATQYKLESADDETTAKDEYIVYTDAAENAKAGVKYNYTSLVENGYYTVATPANNDKGEVAVILAYGSATEVVTISPVASVSAVVPTAYTSGTVTLGDKAYGVSYIYSNLDNDRTGYLASVTPGAIYQSSVSNNNAAMNLYLDAYGYIFAAAPVDGTVTSSDYIYIFAADVVADGVGSIFSTVSAKIEAITDDGAYGVYTLNLKYDAKNTRFVSGTEVISGDDAEALESSLGDKWYSYTIKDGVVTLVDEAETTYLAAKYDVEDGKVAPAYINLNTVGNKIITDATEFVYVDLATGSGEKAQDSKVVSVTKSGAIDIAAGNSTTNLVLVDYTAPGSNVVAKIVVLDAAYSSGTDNKCVYVDVSTETATYDTVNGEWLYTYATTDAAGQPGTITTKGDDVDESDVYALNKDGSLGSAAGTDDFYHNRTGNVIGVCTDGSYDEAADIYLALAEGVEPVIKTADGKLEAGDNITYILNTAGYISGIWVVEPLV